MYSKDKKIQCTCISVSDILLLSKQNATLYFLLKKRSYILKHNKLQVLSIQFTFVYNKGN